MEKVANNCLSPLPKKCFSLLFKTIRFFSSGGVVGRAVGLYAGNSRFKSQPVPNKFSFSAELCQKYPMKYEI